LWGTHFPGALPGYCMDPSRGSRIDCSEDILVDEGKQLLDLIRLGFPFYLLKVHEFADVWDE
jgi:hypothetical protein